MTTPRPFPCGVRHLCRCRLVGAFWTCVGIFLLSFGVYISLESGYVHGRGTYWLGIDYPLRFMILGFVLAVIVHYGLCLFLADYGNPKNRAGREFFLLARYAERLRERPPVA